MGKGFVFWKSIEVPLWINKFKDQKALSEAREVVGWPTTGGVEVCLFVFNCLMHCHYFFLSVSFHWYFSNKVASVLNQNIKNSLIRIYASLI